MAEQSTTPPISACSGDDVSTITSTLDRVQVSSDDEEPMTPTSKVNVVDLNSDEEPMTPPSISKQGPVLLSASKKYLIIFSPDVSFNEPDKSEDYESEDETGSSSSVLTNLGLDIEEFNHKGKIHFRSKEFGEIPSYCKEEEEAYIRDLKKKRGVKDDNYIVESLEKYKEEYLRTKRTYNSLDDLKKHRKEYEDLWQVRKMGKDEVCRKIEDIFHRLIRDQGPNGEGKCFKLKTEKEIIYVEELKCRVLKGERTYCCKYDNKHSMKVFARIDLLLRLIYRFLKTDMTINIRWIPYTYKEMFADISDVQYALDHICKGIGCNRESLNIFASTRGRIAGDIKFTFTIGTTRYVTNCQDGVGIKPRVVARELTFDKLINKDLLLILVVEKDTIFQRLLEDNFHKRFRCIIITGCGVPTVATRALLNKVQKRFDLPVVFLGDCNTGGYTICSNYLCGSKDMAYDSLNLCTPSIKWLGLNPSDLAEHDIPIGKEKVRGLDLLKQFDLVKNSPGLAEEVEKIETKVDIEVMMRQYLKYPTEVYVPLKFQELGSAI